MIDLKWHEIRQVSVEDCSLYDALYAVYIYYIGDGNDSIDKIIEGIQDNIENYIEELIRYASPYDYSNGIQMLKILQTQLPKMNSQKSLKSGTKMSDKIELNWTINISYTFKKYDIFEALENLVLNNEDADYPNYVINWLETNLEDSVEEFLDFLDPMLNIDGEIDNDNITDLLDNEEFMAEFKGYLND